MTIVSVCIPNYVKGNLLYESGNLNVAVGSIVLVPLRSKTVIGVVLEECDLSEEMLSYEVKKIHTIIESFQCNVNTLKFVEKVADSCLMSVNSILKMVITPLIKRYKILLKKSAGELITEKCSEFHPNFSHEQQQILNCIMNSQQKKIVLDGVTGSGKTELYLQIAKQKVLNGGQVLILLPEILLTTQILSRASEIFGFDVHAWHSNVKQKHKDIIWIGVQNNSVKVVIGARSALFLPFSNLQMIILDEEHDVSFKQESMPIYNARDAAIIRAEILNIPILLVSATPSIETMYAVKKQQYQYFHLTNKHFHSAKTEIRIANMWNEKNQSLLHSMSLAEIFTALQNSRQVLIFLNRKGYAAATMCKNCMNFVKCRNCDVKLTYYKHHNHLKCRHCGYVVREHKVCGSCGSCDLLTYHPGIEKVHEEIQKHFPHARTLIVTKDTFEKENSQEILKTISNNEVDIVIGTQILAKGLHFSNMSLCIIVDANTAKFSGDIRSLERTHQILQQVIGRVGREEHGLAILQTFSPKSPLLQSIASGNKKAFIELELENRKIANVPPFTTFILVHITSTNEKKLCDWLKIIKIPETNEEIRVFGPIPAAMHRLQNRYRYQVLFKGITDVHKTVANWLQSIQVPYYISITVDVNPQSFY